MNRRSAPFGTWRSPIDAGRVAAASLRLAEPRLDASGLYWLERRPQEGGRSTLVRLAGRRVADVTVAPVDVRSQVHEYGGGAYSVADGRLWLVDNRDHCVYRDAGMRDWQPLTSPSDCDYGDLAADPPRARVLCVRERRAGVDEPIAELVAIGPAPGQLRVLHRGRDFYAGARVSPDGRELCFLCWDHPNMPWDGTELWRARFDAEGGLADARRVAGGADESLFQPQWAPDGRLYVVSDRSDWWNLYRADAGGLTAIAPRAAELGLPQWVFGQSTYAFAGADSVIAACTTDGGWRLLRIELNGGAVRELNLPFTDIGDVQVHAGEIIFIAGEPARAPALYRLGGGDVPELIRASADLGVDEDHIARPEPLAFPTTAGERAHALFYPPRNPDFRAPDGERPPLLVKCHGGPTGATAAALDPRIQFWTSRGFAVLDVNYRGSTGYGRRYRRRLYGQWGVFDVDDCVAGARFLADAGRVDRARLTISGSSAGGYTVLCALTFRDAFAAGASYYGIGDLEALVRSTHKFESRYMERLIGPYPAARDLYRERSPLVHAARLACPVIFLQGLRDKVVPPDQASTMVAALSAKGVPVAHVTFAEEQHGFRRGENIRRAIEAELYFYGRVLGFPPADAIEPVAIEHLDAD